MFWAHEAVQEVSYTPYSLCLTSRALGGGGRGNGANVNNWGIQEENKLCMVHSSCLRRFLILFLIPTMVACPKTSLKRTPALKSVIASSSQAPGASFLFLATPWRSVGFLPVHLLSQPNIWKQSELHRGQEALTHWLGWGKTRRLLKSSQSQLTATRRKRGNVCPSHLPRGGWFR